MRSLDSFRRRLEGRLNILEEQLKARAPETAPAAPLERLPDPEVVGLTEKYLQVRQQLEEMARAHRERAAAWEAALQQKQEQLEELSKNLGTSQERVSLLEEERNSWGQDKAPLLDENAKLKAQLEKAEQRLREDRQRLLDQIRGYDEMVQRLEEQLQDNKKQSKELQDSTTTFVNTALKNELSRVNELSEKTAQVLSQKRDQDRELSDLRSENQYVKKELEGLKDRMLQAVELGKQLTEELHSKDDEILLLKRKLKAPVEASPVSAPMESMLGKLITLLDESSLPKENPKQ